MYSKSPTLKGRASSLTRDLCNIRGYVARKGQIVDASIVRAPRQRNTREDNAQVKGGEIPDDWSEKKRRHKDVDARWTRKHGVTHYGYKNHISMDREFALVRARVGGHRWGLS